MSFYDNFAAGYKAATEAAKANERQHWTKIHRQNMEAKRADLIMFSGQIIAIMASVDAGIV